MSKKPKTISEPETIKFKVTLKNGKEVELEAIKKQEDYPLEAGVFAQRGELLAFLDKVLTKRSRYVLYKIGAVMADFEDITFQLAESSDAIEPETEEE